MNKSNKKGLKNAVIYARAARVGQESPQEGIQVLAVRKFARHNGYAVVDEYIDEGSSGIADRPALSWLLHDAESGDWKTVLTQDPFRFARDPILLKKIMRILSELAVEVIFTNKPK